MNITIACEFCGQTVVGRDQPTFSDAFLAHVRTVHADFPYPDQAIRNYADATQRLTGSTERLPSIGAVTVEAVTESRIDHWLDFFDHDAFAGNPAWAACYCSEPHLRPRGTRPEDAPVRRWQDNRESMIGLLRAGRSFGYLAYVDNRAAGWVNASKRAEYALYRIGGGTEPGDQDVIAISCFMIAAPYRRHGLSRALLERVLADAPGRGVPWVEAYPLRTSPDDSGSNDDARNFRGPRAMYDEHGFQPVEEREHDTVVRRRVS